MRRAWLIQQVTSRRAERCFRRLPLLDRGMRWGQEALSRLGQGRSKNRRFVALCDTCQGRVGQLQGSDELSSHVRKELLPPPEFAQPPISLHFTSSDKPTLKLQFKLDMFRAGVQHLMSRHPSVWFALAGRQLGTAGPILTIPSSSAPSYPAPQNCTTGPLHWNSIGQTVRHSHSPVFTPQFLPQISST